MKIVNKHGQNKMYFYTDTRYSLCRHCDAEIKPGHYYHEECRKIAKREDEETKILINQAKLAKQSETMSRLWREKRWYNGI